MSRRAWSRLLQAGVATGISDGLFACVLSAGFYGSTITRLWQGVAATLLGKRALEGGIATMLIGILMHFGVAFTWSAIFLLLTMRARWLRRVLQSRGGILAIAAVYGPFIWLVMSLVVIPLLVHRPPNITVRWWIQLLGHIPFVALPMVAMIARNWRTDHVEVQARDDRRVPGVAQ